MRAKGVAQSVAVGARLDFDRQIAAGNGFGNAGHLFEVGHHVAEGARQLADFVLAVDVDLVFQVAGVADCRGPRSSVCSSGSVIALAVR